MTGLDRAVEALALILGDFRAAAASDVANLFRSLNGETWDAASRQRLIELLREFAPDLIGAHVGGVADLTATWYDELAPSSDFVSTVPPAMVPAERIEQSIAWAVSTAATAETALSQLVGTTQRMVMDGQRATVTHNAARERVRYLRHTNYAGACNWCLTQASRGTVYATAAAAVKGPDNCKCIAVPLRDGTDDYTTPPMVVAAGERYADASRQLRAEGRAVTLDSVVKRMDAIDAGSAGTT